jgi:4-carboxymuconolactone decarboxylase
MHLPGMIKEGKVKTVEKSNEEKNSNAKVLVERREFLGGAAALGAAATVAGGSLLGAAVPATASPAGIATDRMPAIPADKMTDAQKAAAAELMSGARKSSSIDGPFIPLLRSPEFMSRVQKAGAYLRFETNLGPNISEFIILIISRQWTQQIEWQGHSGLAAKAGTKPEIIAAIADGRRPTGMSPDEEMVHDFCTELRLTQGVSDATYGRVVGRFGEKGVVEITGLCGYYSMLGMIMNVARTQVPGAKTLSYFPY